MTTVSDHIGERFGHLVVIRCVREPKKHRKFECKCDCGRTTITDVCNVLAKRTSSCGCYEDQIRRSRFTNLVGQKFGKLLALERIVVKRSSGGIYTKYKCRCDCGRVICTYSNGMRNGRIKSCGCFEPQLAAKHALICDYKKHARKRGFPFELSLNEFVEVCSKDCEYCGSAPSKLIGNCYKSGPFTYNGIDRVDSHLGYIVKNCVPCCTTCNRMKMKLTLDKFICCIKKIYSWTALGIDPPNDQEYSKRITKRTRGIHVLWTEYRNSSADRGLPFELSFEEFSDICSKNCHYCNRHPSLVFEGRDGTSRYGGIDRVDSSKGYIHKNVVPCCQICNRMKLAMSLNDFITHVTKIVGHQNAAH